ncbi:hypothetical protein EDB81DRAFT_847312 [Dactylonectria macrodidyma]|uniref:Zn(2)-C6 fungal-type domain-containing protein n=1 Tax=Dactylonectria macrodidyma TaxID=307937 RepID=A0A9P9DQ43_9HYPO|nr:hypothetical protein EDB81DRAFT_847312 [Dactylonectria macrodidyma]
MEVAAHARRRKACDFCVSRKIKCDGVKPTCSNCNVYGVECRITAVETARRRAVARSHSEARSAVTASPQPDRVDAMEARLANIESHLAQLASTQASVAASIPVDAPQSGSSLETPGLATLNMWDAIQATNPNFLGLSLQQTARDMPTSSGQLEFPPLSEVLPVVDNYFQNFNHLTPLFEEHAFMRMLLDWYSCTSTRPVVHWAAINVVLAITFRVLDDMPMDDPRLACCVRNVQSAISDLMARREDLLGAQVLLGLVMVFQGGADPQLAIGLVGSVTRLVQSMQLPLKQGLMGLSPATALHRCRVFWIAYILDRDLSLRDKAPYTQLDSETDVDAPDDPEDGLGILQLPQLNIRFNYLRARVQLAYIEGKAHDVLYSRRSQTLTPQQRLTTTTRIAAMLYDWHRKIPQELQQADTLGQLPPAFVQTMMNMYYRHLECLFRIHSVFLFDDHWLNRVTCYLSPAVIEIGDDEDAVDGEVVRANLAPLPSGWAECVEYCRLCLRLSSLCKQTEYSFWLQQCGASSCLIVLMVNTIEFPDHALVQADLDLIDRNRELFGQRQLKTAHEYCSLLAIADQLDRRARGQVKRIRQRRAGGLLDDDGFVAAFEWTPSADMNV